MREVQDPQSELGGGRDFRLYAVGQAVSVVGDRIAIIALVFLVIQLSKGSALALGAFYVCRALPTLLGGLIAGFLADHFDRRRLMLSCDLGRAFLLTALTAASGLTLWTLYPLVLALFAFTILFDTAARAAIPDVVPEPRMLRANALLQAIDTAADFAYAAGGVLIYALGLRAPFYVDAGTFVFSAAMIFLMHVPGHGRTPLFPGRELLTHIGEGFGFLFAHPFLKWSSLSLTLGALGGGASFVVAPLYADRVLGRSPGLFGPLTSGAFRFSLLEVSLGVGALAGSGLAARLAAGWPRGRIFTTGITGIGVATAALAWIGDLYLAALVMAAIGLCNMLFVISGRTLLQALTPTDLRGRVVAAQLTMANTALVAGSAAGGAVLLVMPYRLAWLALGGIMVMASSLTWARAGVRDQA
ncbi:MAG: MFS transporter [Chloroflexi bacterium]|nr:MFS transporter [Chloroflexota bacterium]